ncbi:hypothetical protein VTN49DRAFT_5882 [Thermomyces lanuginosus]|uniref:uncharacterized protein n=1 Tax=Thermomyces lanuginosus TaxID=5541 RepID=UPI003742864D
MTPAVESLENLSPEELEQLPPEQLDALRIVAYREILQSDNAATVPGPSDVAPATAETTHDSFDVALIRQVKRPRIEAADAEKAPALPKMERYHGKTIPEYNAFVTRFGVHFRRNSYWYDDAVEGEKRKIDAMLEALDDKLLVLWNVHEKEIQGRAHSYEEFLDWLQGLVRPTELLKQDANQKYNDAKQLPTQSVVEFAAYLAQWESQLDIEYSEKQRINHLRAKVLPIIRDEAARYPGPPETYDAYVLYLQEIEEKIPGRRESIRGARSQRNPTSKSNVPSWSRAIDKKTCDGKDPVRTDTESSKTNRQDEGPEKRSKKLGGPTSGTAKALGLKARRSCKTKSLVTTLAVETPRHGKQQIKALIDSGAEAHFVNLAWAEKFLGDVTGRSQRIEAIDGQTVRSHGQHVVRVSLEDHKGESQNFLMPFEAVRVKGYDAIIGFPWLLAVNPDIHWNTGQWFYREPARVSFKTLRIEKKEGPRKDENYVHEIRLITAQKAARAIERGNAAFIVYPEFLHTENETIRVAAFASKGVTNPEELEEFADVLSEEEASILPISSEYDHAIDLIPGKEPPYRPLHRQSLKEQEVLREYLQTALKKGYIRESKSPAGAPVLFVAKKDGTLRLCVDYRGLNAITVKNRYPLPLISETLDRLAGAKIFTQLDLRDAYHRIRIRQGNEWKTAFRTRYGHYEYLVMPFGLVNAPATFQSYINRALAGLLDTCCVAYLDDIVIYSNSVEEHKAACPVDTISFLGYVISPEGISMEEDRVATIKDWPEPQSVKDFHVVTVLLGETSLFVQMSLTDTNPRLRTRNYRSRVTFSIYILTDDNWEFSEQLFREDLRAREEEEERERRGQESARSGEDPEGGEDTGEGSAGVGTASDLSGGPADRTRFRHLRRK